MTERKVWTKEEDDILRLIYEVKKIKKWSSVARCMEAEFHMPGRSGKQCRQRWYNQLSPSVTQNKEWTRDEERELFLLHERTGNRWAEISKRLVGRTDNSVKNHFYSTLRRGMRKLNRFIAGVKGNYKSMNSVLLSKIVNVADDKFEAKKMADVTDQLRQTSCEIVRDLIELSQDDAREEGTEQLETRLAERVLNFSRNYKKKRPKKKKRTCHSDEQESPVTDQLTQEVIPKARKRQPRFGLFKIQVEKSQEDQEEVPRDFLVNANWRIPFARSPGSPTAMENSMNMLGLASIKLPFPFDTDGVIPSQANVSLEQSFNNGIPAPKLSWSTGNENVDYTRLPEFVPKQID